MITYKQRRENALKGRSLVAYYHQDSKISEQYRKIYTNLRFSSAGRANRTMMITSPGYKEGKTTTAVNLAASIAQLGEKVLLIDGDLRNPTLHDTFKTENVGLTNILNGEKTFSDAVHQTGIETLHVLTSGPPVGNPAKLLSSQAMKDFMLTDIFPYDIVLFDTPPFVEVADANILANQCDGVLLVARAGKTKVAKIIEARQLLELSGTAVIGSILNERV